MNLTKPLAEMQSGESSLKSELDEQRSDGSSSQWRGKAHRKLQRSRGDSADGSKCSDCDTTFGAMRDNVRMISGNARLSVIHETVALLPSVRSLSLTS